MTANNQQRWQKHTEQLRDPHEVIGLWSGFDADPTKLLSHRASDNFWQILQQTEARLLISREYEHLLICLGIAGGKPDISAMRLPHPSGIAVDHKTKTVYVISSRNPNQIHLLHPTLGLTQRKESSTTKYDKASFKNVLVPAKTLYFPGSSYMHDLALIKGRLFVNSVGKNAIMEISADGKAHPVWWPRCIEKKGTPDFSANYLQLNSIAAASSLKDSFFSASSAEILPKRPGDPEFPVDKRGVIFSGKTREPICRGLTRPHSVRLYRNKLWVANSGYGEFGYVDKETFKSIARFDGWTRGIGFCGDYAFVGTSRVIPRFYRYAPGLNVRKSVCGIHAIHLPSGNIKASILWPTGNQIFAIEPLPRSLPCRLPLRYGRKNDADFIKDLFYAYTSD